MDDIIEFCGVKCIEYKDIFLPLFTTNLKSSHVELRQAASYGFGMLSKHGGETFAKVLVHATENAISAITKIIEYNNSMVLLIH